MGNDSESTLAWIRAGGIAGMLSNLVIGPVVDRYSFGPIFLASAVVYPLAWLILRGGKKTAR